MGKNKNIQTDSEAQGTPLDLVETKKEGDNEPLAQADDLLLGQPDGISDKEVEKIIDKALKEGKIQPTQIDSFTDLLKKEPELTKKLIETLSNQSPHPDYHSKNATQHGIQVPSQARQVGASIRTPIPATQQVQQIKSIETEPVNEEKVNQIADALKDN